MTLLVWFLQLILVKYHFPRLSSTFERSKMNDALRKFFRDIWHISSSIIFLWMNTGVLFMTLLVSSSGDCERLVSYFGKMSFQWRTIQSESVFVIFLFNFCYFKYQSSAGWKVGVHFWEIALEVFFFSLQYLIAFFYDHQLFKIWQNILQSSTCVLRFIYSFRIATEI